MSERPLVSIITLNFNGIEVTQNLLQTVFKSSYANIEVIVVDNGSSKDPTSSIKELFPKAMVKCTGENLGYAGGINFGRLFTQNSIRNLLGNENIRNRQFFTLAFCI